MKRVFGNNSLLQDKSFLSRISKRRKVEPFSKNPLDTQFEGFDQLSSMSEYTATTSYMDQNLECEEQFLNIPFINQTQKLNNKRILVSSHIRAQSESQVHSPNLRSISKESSVLESYSQLNDYQKMSNKSGSQIWSILEVSEEQEFQDTELECFSQIENLCLITDVSPGQNLGIETKSGQKQQLFNFSGINSQINNLNLLNNLPSRKGTIDLMADEELGNLQEIFETNPKQFPLLKRDSSLTVGENNDIVTQQSLELKEKLNGIICHYLISQSGCSLQQNNLTKEIYQTVENNQAFLSIKERISIADWMAQFCSTYKLSRSTYSLALDYFDRVIQKLSEQKETQKNQQRLEGIASMCMFIASKLEDPKPPRLLELLKSVFQTNSLKQLLSIEQEILQLLNWDLHLKTSYYQLQIIFYYWKTIIDQQYKDTDQNLECEELILDQNTEVRIMYLLDILKLDIQSSLYNPLYIALSLFYIYQICQYNLISDSNSVLALFQNSQQSSHILDISFQQLLHILNVTNNIGNELQDCFQYMCQYLNIFQMLVNSDPSYQKFTNDDMESFVMYYSKYLRSEITSVILKSQKD